MQGLDDRHPSTTHLAQLFAYDHLDGPVRAVSECSAELAETMVSALPDGPELTAGLRKLREAKDCFVRAKAAELALAKVLELQTRPNDPENAV